MVFLFDNPSKWAKQFAQGFTTPFKEAAKKVNRKSGGGGKKHTLPVKNAKGNGRKGK